MEAAEKGKDANRVCLVARRTADFRFSYRKNGEDFYETGFTVVRRSGVPDRIPVTVTERQKELLADWDGYADIRGSLQSFNRSERGRRRLILSVLAETAEPASGGAGQYGRNSIYLEGYVCRQTVFRVTPMGMRVAEILVAVNRPFEGTDYLPCISWGKYARLAEGFSVGDRIWLKGRIQSRDYDKKTEDGHVEKRTAFEVSALSVGRF